MQIAVSWDNDNKTILRWDMQESWTWDDHAEAVTDMRRLVEDAWGAQPPPLAIIRNANRTKTPPGLFQFFLSDRAVANIKELNIRYITIVAPAAGARLFVSYARPFATLNGFRLAVFDSLEAARQELTKSGFQTDSPDR